MPPKKKPGVKTSKKETIPAESTIINTDSPQNVPRSPHFRYVEYDCPGKAQDLRIKCWKVISCELTAFNFRSDPFFRGAEVPKLLESSIKHPTIKKIFKTLKKISLKTSLFTKQRYLRKLCTSWKLDSLNITVDHRIRISKLLNRLLNSKLRICFWNHDSEEPFQEVDIQAISFFRRLRRCALFATDERCIRMQLNTEKLVSCSKPYQLIQKKSEQEDGSIYQGLVNTPVCYDKLSFEEIVTIPDLPLLPNLQDLRLSWDKSKDEETIDASFLKQYSQLRCLHIYLCDRQIESLDFLMDLPNLTELNFSSVHPCGVDEDTSPAFQDFPNLRRLEKFGLTLWNTKRFKMKNVRDLILKNKNLKSLDLGLPIEDFDIIFKTKSFKLRPNLEVFRIRFNHIGDADSETAKRIAQFLRKCNFLKGLDIELHHHLDQIDPDLNEIFLKNGLAQMKSLQDLTLNYLETDCHLLKHVFTKLVNLKSLKLIIKYHIDSQNLDYILDGLAKLHHLQKLEWSSKTSDLTPAVLNKLSNFLSSIRKLKHLQITLIGFDREEVSILNNRFLPKLPLSPKTLIFIDHRYYRY